MEILNCPFCQGKARISSYWLYHIDCVECGSKSGHYTDEKHAIEAWNTRPKVEHTFESLKEVIKEWKKSQELIADFLMNEEILNRFNNCTVVKDTYVKCVICNKTIDTSSNSNCTHGIFYEIDLSKNKMTNPYTYRDPGSLGSIKQQEILPCRECGGMPYKRKGGHLGCFNGHCLVVRENIKEAIEAWNKYNKPKEQEILPCIKCGSNPCVLTGGVNNWTALVCYSPKCYRNLKESDIRYFKDLDHLKEYWNELNTKSK